MTRIAHLLLALAAPGIVFAAPQAAKAASLDELKAEIAALKAENALLRERDRLIRQNGAIRARIASREAPPPVVRQVPQPAIRTSAGDPRDAYAADMNIGMPYGPPPYSWTGCYVGLHGGGGWVQNEWPYAPPLDPRFRGSGFLAGGQAGCDYQLGAWVVGVEGQYSWANLEGTRSLMPTTSLSTTVDGLATVTGRAGYAFGRILPYLKAGFAWAHSDHQIDDISGGEMFTTYKGRGGVVGWTAGGGVEFAMLPNLSVKAEYNFIDLGTNAFGLTCLFGGFCAPDQVPMQGTVFPFDIRQHVHAVKFGVNYRFGRLPVEARN